MDHKEKLGKGIRLLGVTLPLMFIGPMLINLGFKGIGRGQIPLGYILLIFGLLVAIAAIITFVLALRTFFDYLFDKKK